MTRNHRCRFYETCLTEAARRNDKRLSCESCPFQSDHEARLDLSDLPGIVRLLAAVYCPDLSPGMISEVIDGDVVGFMAALLD